MDTIFERPSVSDIPSIPSIERTTSIWDRFSSAPSEAATPAVPTPSGAALIPDLQLVKQALSTFAVNHIVSSKEKPGNMPKENNAEAGNLQRKRSPSGACCAVSVRDSNTGLSVPSQGLADRSENTWSRSLRRKVSHHAPANFSSQTEVNGTLHHEPCQCGITKRLRFDMLGHFIGTFSPVHRYVLSATHAISAIYHPALSELHNEYMELLALLHTVAETTSTLAEFIIRRASRGVGVSKRALESASRKIRDNMPDVPHPHVDQISLIKARQQIESLSDYVEDQAALLVDYVEEQTIVIHDKSLDSLRHAKKGLDKLIKEARKAVGEDAPVKEPMPKIVRRQAMFGSGPKQKVKIVDRFREKRAKREGVVPVVQREIEERSRAGKLWDALHHVSLTKSPQRTANHRGNRVHSPW